MIYPLPLEESKLLFFTIIPHFRNQKTLNIPISLSHSLLVCYLIHNSTFLQENN